VVLAYQGLLDDGYLFARERSGYFVADKALEPTVRPAKAGSAHADHKGTDPNWKARLLKHPAAQANIFKPLDWQSYTYPFIYGQVDHNLFPLAEWRDCARQALGKKWLGTWTNDTWAFDDPLLVEQIRRRILPRRGIMASDDEILITLGAQNALYLIVSLLIDDKSRVAMEEPGFTDMLNIFRLKTQNVALVPVDDGGLTLTEGVAQSDLVFVTPSHQFPTTATMPLARRLDLLKLASKHNFVIIEDDYEFETNYVNEPCPALKSLDDEGRVIYVGSLSKTLFPGLRKAYRTRWEIMGAALQTHLPESARIPSFGGTSFWVAGPRAFDSEMLAKHAAARGIVIEPGRIHFGADPAPNNFFRLAFSSIEEKKIEPGIRLLAETILDAQQLAAE
jgi:GntR family transcriptional regulator/MocR family aminotransferase